MNLKSNRGAMLPIFAMIIIALGVVVSAGYFVHTLYIASHERARFMQDTVSASVAIDEVKLFEKELIISAYRDAWYDFDGYREVCPEKIKYYLDHGEITDIYNKFEENVNDYISSYPYRSYKGYGIPQVSGLDTDVTYHSPSDYEGIDTESPTHVISTDLGAGEVYLEDIDAKVTAAGSGEIYINVYGKNSTGDIVCSGQGDAPSGEIADIKLYCYNRVKTVYADALTCTGDSCDPEISKLDFTTKIVYPNANYIRLIADTTKPLITSIPGVNMNSSLVHYDIRVNGPARPRPDLIVSNIEALSVNDNTPINWVRAGESAKISATIRNIGCSEVPSNVPMILRVTSGGTKSDVDISDYSGFDEKSYTTQKVISNSPGHYAITAKVDQSDVLPEVYNSNNAKSLQDFLVKCAAGTSGSECSTPGIQKDFTIVGYTPNSNSIDVTWSQCRKYNCQEFSTDTNDEYEIYKKCTHAYTGGFWKDSDWSWVRNVNIGTGPNSGENYQYTAADNLDCGSTCDINITVRKDRKIIDSVYMPDTKTQWAEPDYVESGEDYQYGLRVNKGKDWATVYWLTCVPANRYTVYYKKPDESMWKLAGSASGTSTSYTITGLSCGTTYDLGVVAWHVSGTIVNSAKSQTPITPESAPGTYQLKGQTKITITTDSC